MSVCDSWYNYISLPGNYKSGVWEVVLSNLLSALWCRDVVICIIICSAGICRDVMLGSVETYSAGICRDVVLGSVETYSAGICRGLQCRDL